MTTTTTAPRTIGGPRALDALDALDPEYRLRMRALRRGEQHHPCEGLGYRWAVILMAGRYGQANLQVGMAPYGGDRLAYHLRAAARRYAALARLTRRLDGWQ